MDFDHSEERQMLGDTITRWVMNDYPLKARLEAGVSELGYAPDRLAALAELGVIGALFGEDAGGFGGAGFDLAVVFEGLGKGLVIEPLLPALLAGSVLENAGNDGQKALLEPVIEGAKTLAFAHFEADDGDDPRWIETTAKKGADGWDISGHKAVVRNGGAADYLVVSARTSGEAGQADGLSLFLVPSDAKGIETHAYSTIEGGSAAEISLDLKGLPMDCLIGDEGQGLDILNQALGRGIVAIGAEALGIMDVIRAMTIEYIQTRKQFGVPIGKFQALQHRMAEMLLEIEQMRSAVIRAAAVLEEPGVERERAVAALKVTTNNTATLVAEESIQIHGGIGMTWEHDLGHFAKRLTMITHELGDEDYHLTRYIALGKGEHV